MQIAVDIELQVFILADCIVVLLCLHLCPMLTAQGRVVHYGLPVLTSCHAYGP